MNWIDEELKMLPQTKFIKSLLPDWKAKNWQFDLRICPDCNTLQIKPGKVIKEGTQCDNSMCETVLTLCQKGKHAGEFMWINENWD